MIRDLSRGAGAPLLAALALATTGFAFAQDAPSDHPRPGPDLGAVVTAAPKTAKVGEAAPDFTLKDTQGSEHKLSELTKSGKIVVLEWFNPDCPVSAGFHTPDNDVMVKLARELSDKNVVWLAINSGAPGKAGSGLDRNVKAAKDFALPYPVLLDESGDVGRAYGAKTTPHMYVIAKDGKLAYAGAIDDSAGRSAAKTNYVRDAVTALLAGKEVAVKESHPFGCGVKYAD